MVFEDAHATSSWTLPSFASLMTSHYTSTHRCWKFRSRLPASFTTLAEVLAGAGYHTAAIVSHTFLGSKHGLSQGFAEYDESLVYRGEESDAAISSPPVTNKALAFLDRQAATDGQRPWFLWVHYFDPHSEYREHEGISERFGETAVGRYDGEIAFTDQHIGQLLERLESLGMAENTVIAFVADHGEEFRDHGRQGHGLTLFREVLRVPFAIRAPGLAARRVPDAVSIVDFMPTVLTLLGVPPPPSPMAGRDLTGLMAGDEAEERGLLAETRLWRRDTEVRAFILGRWKLIVVGPSPPGDERSSRVMLFDRETDGAEKHSLAAARPEVVKAMTQLLEQSVARATSLTPFTTEPPEVEMSPAELESLRALGYVDGEDADRKQ